MTTDFEVTGFEPPTRFEVTITGFGYEPGETLLLEAVDQGTLVRGH